MTKLSRPPQVLVGLRTEFKAGKPLSHTLLPLILLVFL